MPNTRVPATGEAMPAAKINSNIEEETPYQKVRRIAKELSDALAECDPQFHYSFVEVHARTPKGERHIYFNCMPAEDRLHHYARCFAQAAMEVDPTATESGLFTGEEGHPVRFAVTVSAKRGEA